MEMSDSNDGIKSTSPIIRNPAHQSAKSAMIWAGSLLVMGAIIAIALVVGTGTPNSGFHTTLAIQNHIANHTSQQNNSVENLPNVTEENASTDQGMGTNYLIRFAIIGIL